MDNIVELDTISKRYGEVEVFSNLTLNVQRGQSVSIVGPSGSGKSTLLHIAGLMDRPSSGSVRIGGRETMTLSEAERAKLRLETVGFVFQFHYLLADFNVLENVLIPCRIGGDDLEAKTAEAHELLAKLNLSHRLTHRPQELSGGEQQRVAFARALIRRPKLLLCDEPTGNLDPRTADDMLALLWAEVEERELTTIIVTHNESVAKKTDVAYHLDEALTT